MGSSKDNLVGKVLDERYLIEKELGVGGIGAVYVARDLRVMGKNVVVKVLLEESYQNEYVVKKFRQEVEALSRVEHPNIVGILDSGTLSDGMPYIVLQFIEGVSVRTIIRPEGSELERSALIVRQVGAALTAAHEKGIFHRDLKPENIMLQRLGEGEEQVKVIDFGIAKIKDSVIAPDTMVLATAGTIAYMSPEQLSAGAISAPSDIYALGVVAFELLTGRKPFNPESPFQLLEMQRSGVKIMPKDLRPALPDVAQHVLLKALAFDPNERYQRARDFGDELYEALTGLPAGRTGRLDATRARALTQGGYPGDMTSAYATARMPTDVQLGGHSTDPSRVGLDAATNIMPPQAQTGVHAGVTTGAGASTSVVAPAKKSGSKVFLILGGLVFLFLVVAGLGFAVWKFTQGGLTGRTQDNTQVNSSNLSNTNRAGTTNANTSPNTAPAAETALAYSLTVQRTRDGKPYKEPFESSGQEIFENGWKFRLNITSPKDGYLYLINEGLNDRGETALTMLFPNPATNSGSTQVVANQTLQTPSEPGYFTLSGKPETEKIWIIWSSKLIDDLEAIKSQVFSGAGGGEITDPSQAQSVRDIISKHDPSQVVAEKVEKRTLLKGRGDVLVYLAKLEHQ
ncbi:MAG TPA: protein kinase [Pyrinomonadaceae bacterium]|jgi:tRNA A-37 threonylcarbamoyl transferase component Bud32